MRNDGWPKPGGAHDSGLGWLALAVLSFFAALFSLLGTGMIADEFAHYPRIVGILHGDFSVNAEYMPMPPGYHLLVAGVLRSIGLESLAAVRVIDAISTGFAAYWFYCVRRRIYPQDGRIATAQFLVFPLAIPFYFLAYTDGLSLALVLAATAAALASRHWLAAIVLSLACTVRQNNVLAVGLLPVLTMLNETTIAQLRNGSVKALFRGLIQSWSELVPYLLPGLGVAGFWLWNGAISASPALSGLNPNGTLHLGNAILLLFVAALLLPVHVLQGLKEFAEQARRQSLLWLLPPVLFGLIYWLFVADHPLNTPVPSGHEMFLRARLFKEMDGFPAVRLAFSGLATCAALGLAMIPLGKLRNWMWGGFALIFLCTQWLIDVRYLLIPAVLWLAFRRLRTPVTEVLTLLWWIALSAWLLAGIIDRSSFP